MSTAYVSGRVPARYERLVARQARAARTSKSDLVARYVIEKSLRSVENTVRYSGWPGVLVTRALAYAQAFPEEIRTSREGETDTASAVG